MEGKYMSKIIFLAIFLFANAFFMCVRTHENYVNAQNSIYYNPHGRILRSASKGDSKDDQNMHTEIIEVADGENQKIDEKKTKNIPNENINEETNEVTTKEQEKELIEYKNNQNNNMKNEKINKINDSINNNTNINNNANYEENESIASERWLPSYSISQSIDSNDDKIFNDKMNKLTTNDITKPINALIEAHNSNVNILNNNINNFLNEEKNKTINSLPHVHSSPDTTAFLKDYFGGWFFKETSGKCKKGVTYKINSEEDLKMYENELECIYALGNAPMKPPIGIWYGTVLKLVGINIFNFIVAALWAGKLAMLGKCRSGLSKFYNVVYNFVNKDLTLPAFMYVGFVREKTLQEGEHDDKKKHLFVDYTLNFDDMCPAHKKANPNLQFMLVNDPFPFSQIIDLVRCVGRTEDGGYILLGKSLFRDGYKFPIKGDATLAFWSVINYDDSAFSDPSICTLESLEEDFAYKHAGGIDQFYRFTMLDDLLENPIETILQYIDIHIRKPLGLPPLSKSLKYVNEHYPIAGLYVETNPENIISNERSYKNDDNHKNTTIDISGYKQNVIHINDDDNAINATTEKNEKQ